MSRVSKHNLTLSNEYDYRDLISEALWQEQYIHYAYGEGPLTISELPYDLRTSDGFHEFVEAFGWPDAADGKIEPLPAQDREFDSEAVGDFLERFLSRDSRDSSTDLNNFRIWLVSEPHERLLSSSSGVKDMYGAHPALHRLYVLMPEVMTALRVLLVNMEAQHGEYEDGIAIELSLGANSEIVKAIMIIYEVTARLLKVDDLRRQQGILFPGSERTMPDILDAHSALRQ